MAKLGRPKGSKTKPQISDFVSREETQELINIAKEKAKSGDTVILKFLLEQVFGKAVQSLSNDGDKPFMVSGVEISVRK